MFASVPFAAGERVSYWSESCGKWIGATVTRYNSDDDTYDLNVKKRALSELITA